MVVILISACSPQGPLRVGPFGYSDGLAAKRAASAICAGQGKRLNPQDFGHFTANAWEFAGGCVA